MKNSNNNNNNNNKQLLWDFDIHTDHLISARRPDHIIINKKKRICKIAVPADHRIKLKECEKRDKYLVLAGELKKQGNMKVTILPIVIDSFGTIIKGLLKGLEDLVVGGRVKTIQTTALLRTTRILRKVLETCCHSNASENPLANVYEKNSQKRTNNNNPDLIIINKKKRTCKIVDFAVPADHWIKPKEC